MTRHARLSRLALLALSLAGALALALSFPVPAWPLPKARARMNSCARKIIRRGCRIAGRMSL